MSNLPFSYTGNKRREVKDFMPLFNTDTKNIVEPFCGSGSISFGIYKLHGSKYNYYLNDNDEELYKIFELLKTVSVEEIETQVNKLLLNMNSKEEFKELHKTYKQDNDIYKYILLKKYSVLGRLGFTDDRFVGKVFKFTKLNKEFAEFLKLPNVFITCEDWFDIFERHKNNPESSLIFDPPYLMSCNNFYIDLNSKSSYSNVYEFMYYNKINSFPCKIYIILCHNWIIDMLFKDFIKCKYDKMYDLSKKIVSHVIITNL